MVPALFLIGKPNYHLAPYRLRPLRLNVYVDGGVFWSAATDFVAKRAGAPFGRASHAAAIQRLRSPLGSIAMIDQVCYAVFPTNRCRLRFIIRPVPWGQT